MTCVDFFAPCLSGRDIEIVIAGVVDNACSTCENYNGTYLFTAPQSFEDFSDPSCRISDNASVSNCTFNGLLSWRIVFTAPATAELSVQLGYFPTFGLLSTFDSTDINDLIALCEDGTVTLTWSFDGGGQTLCTATGATATINVL
jgi:hypothetical protein